jgi:hypothetical protein
MRVMAVLMTLASACSFSVHGVDLPSDPGSGALPSLPQPNAASLVDAGAASGNASQQPDLATPIVGGPCATDADCGGLHCVQTAGSGDKAVSFDSGYCTADCSVTACPTGSACADIGGAKLCVAACPPASCRTGYRCCDKAATTACVPTSSCD